VTQRFVRAVFMRGGTSKGVFFHASDLPEDAAERDALLLAALGSPDPYGRQLDGMGGGLSSLSKAAVIGPPTRPDADADYTFAQVAVDAPVVDYGANCGNLSSAVGPFAVDEGLVDAADGQAVVRIHNTNTGKVIHAHFEVRDGRAVVAGDFALPGVAGTGAPIRLEFLDPAGSRTSALLPTGSPADVLDVAGLDVAGLDVAGLGRVRVSMVDAANPLVMVAAGDLGLAGAEHPDVLEAVPGVMAALDALRRAGGVAMGLGASPPEVPLSTPKVAVLSAPQEFVSLDGATYGAGSHDLGVRMVSMGRVHRAVTVTGGPHRAGPPRRARDQRRPLPDRAAAHAGRGRGMTSTTRALRARVTSGPVLVCPGAANALAARIVEDCGFEAAYVTGAGIANTYLGVPDIGLVTLTELAGHVSAIRDAVHMPLVVEDALLPMERLAEFRLVLFANLALQGAVAGMQRALSSLRDTGSLQEAARDVASWHERQRLVGTDALDELGRRYASSEASASPSV
jgi:2-methylaconitate cis-trans-isomerase PrpF